MASNQPPNESSENKKKNFSIRFDSAQDEELASLEKIGLPKAAAVRICVNRALPTVSGIVKALEKANVQVDEKTVAEVVADLKRRRNAK